MTDQETTSSSVDEFGWLLTNFVDTTEGVEDAIAVSSDGLRLAASDGLPRETADQFAAITSGLASLTLGAARCFANGSFERVIVEMDRSYLFISVISHGSVLGVVASKGADIGQVAYQMTVFIDRVGEVLTPELIVELKNALTL